MIACDVSPEIILFHLIYIERTFGMDDDNWKLWGTGDVVRYSRRLECWELVHKEKLMVQFFHHFIQQVPHSHKGIKLMRFKSEEDGASQKGSSHVSPKWIFKRFHPLPGSCVASIKLLRHGCHRWNWYGRKGATIFMGWDYSLFLDLNSISPHLCRIEDRHRSLSSLFNV